MESAQLPIKPKKGYYVDKYSPRYKSDMVRNRYKSPYLDKLTDTAEALYPNRKVQVGP